MNLSNDATTFCEVTTLEESFGEFHSHFDWWQVSLDVSSLESWDTKTGEVLPGIDVLKLELNKAFPASSWITSGGRNGYDFSEELKRGDSRICLVSHGGIHPLANITASGSRSAEVRSFMVSLFPTGKVSRVDSAFDSLSGSAEFRRVTAWAEDRATQAGINCTWIKNTKTSKGDTLYIGSKQSRVQIRIYEKGKQMSHRESEWWRVEVQLRPDSKSKSAVYSWSAGHVWSASRLTRDLWAYLGGEKLQAVNFQYHEKEKDLDDKLLHLATQYGNLLSQALAIHGDASLIISRMDALLISVGKPPITGRVAAVAECPF